MRVRSLLLSVPFIAGLALAQSTPAPAGQQTNPGQQPPAGQTPPTMPATPDQTSRPGRTGSASDTMGTSQQGNMQSGQSTSQSGSEAMKTKNYSGSLVDASCAGASASAGSSSDSTKSTSSSGSASANAGSTSGSAAANAGQTSSADRTGTAGRSAGTGNCAISASTTQFALKTKDGQIVRFDDVGNSRAQEAMKTHKNWSNNSGKDVHVTVSGVQDGDKMTVVSIK